MKRLALILIPVLHHVAWHASAHPGHEPAASVFLAAAAVEPGISGPSRDRQGEVTIITNGDYRIILASGLPDHSTGRFPNRGNPNRITPQSYSFRMPLNPKPAETPIRLGLHPFGIAVNGVVFDPGAAEWWRDERGSRWQYEAMAGGRDLGLDANHAHVQPNGAYHYHAMPSALVERLTDGKPKIVLTGWGADGFPVYVAWGFTEPGNSNSAIKRLRSSYRVKAGERPDGPGGSYDGTFVSDYEFVKGLGDLDECNGRFGVTPEFPEGTYYYVLTDDFPCIPRLFKGAPDPSFFRRVPVPGGQPRRRPSGRPDRPG